MRLSTDLIVQRPEGLYCPAGDFYIDPWRPVARAVITHAHADHARRGHGHYLAVRSAEGLLRARLGAISLMGLDYGQRVVHHGVGLSLHPAGHVLGSAQVRLEHGGQVGLGPVAGEEALVQRRHLVDQLVHHRRGQRCRMGRGLVAHLPE